MTKIEKCKSTPTTLTQRNARVTIDNRPMTYKQAFYKDGTMANAVSTDRGWNYNPGKVVYFEPDLTKYDKQFVDAYLKMKAEFEGHRHRLRVDTATNDNLLPIGKRLYWKTKGINKLYEKINDKEIKTGCNLSIYDYGKGTNMNGELIRSIDNSIPNTIAISKTQYPALKSAFEKIIKKTKHPNKHVTLSGNEITALVVYFHETVHDLHSKSLFDMGLSDVQIKPVECLVECLARKTTIDFIKMKFGIDSIISEGNYDKYYSVFEKYSKNIDYEAILNLIKNNRLNDIELELYKLFGITKTEQLIIVSEIATKLQ